MAAVRLHARSEIDIRPSCLQMLKDIGHPFARGEPVYDITFENVQAGERTSHLFRLANFHGGFVVGTGDLSELALGWCTYGVGDHMSHYNVNASVPKTLIKHLVRWVAASGSVERGDDAGARRDPRHARSAPSSCPATDAEGRSRRRAPRRASARTSCRTSTSTTILRYGFAPTKVAFLAWTAWHDASQRRWPDAPDVRATRTRWPRSRSTCARSCYRFFKTSQFKRSCVPNAPKVGSGGSLSPRGDWRAPSDSEATVWLEDVERIPDA